jgi:hypothetical protein
MPPLPGASAEPAIACDVLAHGAVRVPPETLPALRQRPGPGAGERLPASFLKHADEQSVAGLAAVLRAIADHDLTGTAFTSWGVVGCPRFIGRVAMAAAMHRFAAEGAWGISPHLIPHRSLHAPSGTVSQALKIQGPNFGVGGGPRGAAEGLLAAAALLGRRPLPGVWLVLTGCQPEPAPDAHGHTATPSVCAAVALALVPARPDWRGPRLRVGAAGTGGARAPEADLTLEGLLAALTADPIPARAAWGLGAGARVCLERVGVGLPPPHLFHCQARGRRANSGAGPGREP